MSTLFFFCPRQVHATWNKTKQKLFLVFFFEYIFYSTILCYRPYLQERIHTTRNGINTHTHIWYINLHSLTSFNHFFVSSFSVCWFLVTCFRCCSWVCWLDGHLYIRYMFLWCVYLFWLYEWLCLFLFYFILFSILIILIIIIIYKYSLFIFISFSIWFVFFLVVRSVVVVGIVNVVLVVEVKINRSIYFWN